MAIQDFAYGGLLDEMAYQPLQIVLPPGLAEMSPQQKAQVYNQFIAQGFSNDQIRQAVESQFGQQTNENWSALQNLASGLLTPQQPTNRPKAVLFGDSMSEFVGYNADGSPNGKYGASVADVIGNNLGISVTNLATGGETSNEALRGGSKFGAFADYIAQNRPEYAIIRYGAADAIKNKDPNITLQSVQQMVDIARANGVTPIIVGVSELYGSQNSKTGNIAGYIDPQAEQRAAQINAGLSRIAANNGVSFTDVRSLTSAGNGDLLDGVHTNVEFGKKMADAISSSIAEQRVIEGIRVPDLPSNVTQLSAQEKGRLYNQLIDQGYTDAQIRTAAKLQSDENWDALKRVAAEVKNTTPAQIERQTALSANVAEAPVISPPRQAAQATQMVAQPAPKDLTEFVFSRMSPAEMNAYTMLRESGVNEMLPLTTIDGKSYFQNSDGSIVEIERTGPTGANQTIYSAGGEVVERAELPNYGATSYSDIIGNAAIAAITGGMFGPAGAGLLSAPSAAALGSGLTTLGRTGDIKQALQGAAVGALGAYGAEQVINTLNNLSYNTAFAAADAAQLANQGLDAAAIAQNLSTYVDPATAATLANTAANQAFALADATQLTQQGLSVDQVTQVLQSGGVNPGVAASAAQAAADGVTELSATDVVSNIRFQPQQQVTQQGLLTPESVTVTGERLPSAVANVPGVASGLLSTATPVAQQSTQRVEVAAQPEQPAPFTFTGTRILPSDISARSTAEKAQLYNQLRDQGYTDQQVRVIAERELGPTATQGWEYLISAADALRPQQVQVTAPAQQQITPDIASNILSSLTGQPISVAGSTQQVQVTGEAPQQISQADAAAVLSSVIGQQVTVTAAPVAPPSAAEQVGGLLAQTVPVTAAPVAAPAAAPEQVGGLLGQVIPTQTVPVAAPVAPAPAVAPETVGGIAGAVLPVQTVPVSAAPIPAPAPIPEQVGGLLGTVIPPQSVPVTAAPIPSTATPETVGAVAGAVLPTQTVPVTSTPITAEITPEIAGSILTALTGSPVSVGAPQTVEVTGQGPGQNVTPEVAAAILSSVVGQTVTVTGTPERAPQTPIIPAPTPIVPPVVTAPPTPVAPPQTVPVVAPPAPVVAPPIVPVVTPPVAPPQQVTVEDRYVPPPAPAPTIPVVPTQSVTVGGTTIPTATATIPSTTGAIAGGAGGMGGAGGSATASNQLNVGLLDAAAMAALLSGINAIVNRPSEPTGFDQAYANLITGAGRPSFSQQPFTPYSNFFQIQPTTVYNPFATTAPFGAGRFGAVNQPITLPRPVTTTGGLL